MANRNNIHIVKRGDQWGALREGSKRVSGNFDTQAQTIQAGRKLAELGKGEILIHGENGRIRARDSYGNDPFPPKDLK